jgi:hypothetical protein
LALKWKLSLTDDSLTLTNKRGSIVVQVALPAGVVEDLILNTVEDNEALTVVPLIHLDGNVSFQFEPGPDTLKESAMIDDLVKITVSDQMLEDENKIDRKLQELRSRLLSAVAHVDNALARLD